MELRMKYHYSYFIYPYVVKENRYRKYIQGLLKNSKCTLKTFEKRKNFSMYNYFLPTIRNFMFRSFEFAGNMRKFENIRSRIKSQYAFI